MDDSSSNSPTPSPGSISTGDISGTGIAIGHGATATVGYTAEQVSALLAQISATFQPKPFDGRCPYLGLDAFAEEDADRFFGREAQVTDLLARVKESRALFIAGPSGSGKSSLVRAGLIHALKQGALPGSDRWLYASLNPQRSPLENLALAVSKLADSLSAGDDIRTRGQTDSTVLHRWVEIALGDRRKRRAILFVDQFEETFTQVTKEEERSAFLNLLTTAASAEQGRVTVLFALRSDFVPHCVLYPQLNTLLNQQFFQLGAMEPHELVSAAARPALEVGLRIDPDLIAQIISDMHDEPGALPLMQFALKDLFDYQKSKGGVIALMKDDYAARGGIRKSLERHADAAFNRLSENERAVAHEIFKRLIQPGRSSQDTRRTALFSELASSGAEAESIEQVAQKLADARLITTDEKREGGAAIRTVTIAHETLIDAWPWLRRLVNENREAIVLQNQISEDAREWEMHQRDASYLYFGARLENVQERLLAKEILLDELAQAFIATGVEAEEARKQQEEAQRQKELGDARKLAEAEKRRAEEQVFAANRLRTRNRIITAIGALALIVAFVAISFWSLSNRNLAAANENALTAQAAITQSALNLATAQAANTQTAQQRDEAVYQSHLALSRQLVVQASSILRDDIDLGLLLSIEAYHAADTFEAQRNLLSGIQLEPKLKRLLHGHESSVIRIIFSPNGQRLMSFGVDDSPIVWDVATGQALYTLTGFIGNMVFHPDGGTLAMSREDGSIVLLDVNTGLATRGPFLGHTRPVTSLAYSSDGEVLASGSCREIENERCAEGEIFLWDADTGQLLADPLYGHADSVLSLAFTPDGKMLASGSCGEFIPEKDRCSQGEIHLWGMPSGQPLDRLLVSHKGAVNNLQFSLDGSRLLSSSSQDGTAIVWDVESRQPLSQSIPAGVTFSSDLGVFALPRDNEPSHELTVYDVQTGREIENFTGHTDSIFNWALSPDRQVFASASCTKYQVPYCLQGEIRLWGLSDSGEPMYAHQGYVDSIAFSPDGKLLATGSCGEFVGQGNGCSEGEIGLWEVDTEFGQPLGKPIVGYIDRPQAEFAAAFSPDEMLLATSSHFSGAITIWDTPSGEAIKELQPEQKGVMTSLAFSPDGRALASGRRDGNVILWNVSTGQPLGPPLIRHSGEVWNVTFSPDGERLISGSQDGHLIMWDVSTRQPIGEYKVNSEYWTVGFTENGERLIVFSEGEIWIWDVSHGQFGGEPLSRYKLDANFVIFSPNMEIAASSRCESYEETVCTESSFHLWNSLTGTAIGEPLSVTSADFWAIALSPDGEHLAVGDTNGKVHLLNIRTGQMVASPLQGHTAVVNTLDFSADGKLLASGSWDGTVILWDVDARQPLSDPLSASASGWWITSVTFGPQGDTLLSYSDDMTILWNLRAESWIARACSIANRNLTQVEWQQYLKTEPYRNTCESFSGSP